MRRVRLTCLFVVLLVITLMMAGCFSKEVKKNLEQTERFVTQASTSIVISEVYYDTAGTDSIEEYIELYNMNSSALDLSGWTLTDNYSTYTIANGVSINAQSTLIIARDSGGFSNLFGFNPDISDLSLALGNSGDMVILKNNSGTEVDFVAWEGEVAGWSTYSNTGNSIERNPANIDTDVEGDWVNNVTPTPGFVTTSVGTILISEVYYDTTGTDSVEEYVELYNTGTVSIDISGWTLTDNYSSFTIPANTIVEGQSTVIVAADAAGFNALFGFTPDVSGSSLALSNSGDEVTLKNTSAAEIDFVAWENYVSGWSVYANTSNSIERNPVNIDTDTVSDWLSNVTPTPGSINSGGSIQGSILLSEVYYDTTGTDSVEEFVELYNISATSVDVSGWTLSDNAGTYTIPNNTTVAGESTLIIAADSSGFNALFGFAPDVSGLSLALSNSGDQVILENADGIEVDFVAWENYVSGWAIYANTGNSLDRNPVTTDTDTYTDWLSDVTPTPGGVNGDTGGTDPNDPNDPPINGDNPAPGVLKVHFIDVGQGDSILVQAPTGEVMLVDAGNYQIEIENKVLSYLSDLGLGHIDITVATHPHSDHIGSLDAVINTYAVGKAYDSGYPYTSISYTDYMAAIENNDVPFYLARRGQFFALSADVNVEVLSPTDDIINTTTDTNDASIVLKVTYGSTSFILTGDASQIIERDIISAGFDIDANVLKVGHHGSYSATAPEFVDAITPDVGAVITCGENNPYGHPHTETIDTLNAKNVTIYRTDLDGAMNGNVVMTSDGTTISVQY